MNTIRFAALAASILTATSLGTAQAQAPAHAAVAPASTPKGAAAPKPTAVARELFGAKKEPAKLEARSFGFYARGCLAGATALPINGKTWQVMRLSRNRNWGHPKLIAFLEKFAAQVAKTTDWPGLLVGDIAQPRGGPMISGHASHQIGLDADIWLNPMPKRTLTNEEREEISAVSMLAADKKDVDPKIWTPSHTAVIKLAAKSPDVERIFVNAAIKKALCREAGTDRSWLHKVRAYYGHHYHFHVRMKCPADSPTCEGQTPPPDAEQCGKDLDFFFKDAILHPKPPPPDSPKAKPKPPMMLSQLPTECRQVLLAP